MKKHILFPVFILICLSSFAQETDELKSGTLLFISPSEPYSVILEGYSLGMTPLLIKDATAGTLQLFGKDSYVEVELSIDRSKKNVTVFSPEGVPYYGWLNLPNIQMGSTLNIDGGEPINIDNPTLVVPEGIHDFTLSREGYMPLNFTMEISRLSEITMAESQREAAKVFLPEGIPRGSKMVFSSEKEQIEEIYENQEFFLLPRGKWELSIESAEMMAIHHSFELDQESTTLNFNLPYYSPAIELAGFNDNSLIIFNNQELIPREEKLELSGKIGENILFVETPGYLPVRQEIELSGNVIEEIQLDLIKDPQIIKANRQNTGWILLGSGLSMFAGGMIMNNDKILINNTAGYEQYQNMKYTSLGIVGTGLISLMTGSGFILSSLGANS